MVAIDYYQGSTHLIRTACVGTGPEQDAQREQHENKKDRPLRNVPDEHRRVAGPDRVADLVGDGAADHDDNWARGALG